MVGVGGGVFAVPLLHLVFGLPMRTAVATSVLIVCALSSSATVTELLRDDSALHPGVIGALIAGALPGAFVGFRVAHRLPQRVLKLSFAGLLVLAALRTALSTPAGGAGLAHDLPPAEFATAGAIGFVAGFSSPLLGVGGGVLAIPLLLYSLDGIHYVEARACSVATTIVSSGLSALLYLRAKEARLDLALPFALVAAAGGFIGVALVHQTGGPGVARWLLVALLTFLAGRFVRRA